MKLPFYSIYLIVVLYQSSKAQKADDEDIQSSTMVYSLNDAVTRCSKSLSKTLNRLCDNHYKIIKRDTSILLGKLMPQELQEHMQKQQKFDFESWRRVRRQIADECCIQPCTIGQLILYCPEDAKLVQEHPDIFYYD